MGFINSDNIHVFPAANRGADFLYSRLTTEYNLAQNLRAFASNDGFVVSPQAGSLNAAATIAFIIKGYYFETVVSDIITAVFGDDNTPQGTGTIYAMIKLSAAQGTTGINANETLELQGQVQPNELDYDDAGTFKFSGVSFSSAKPSTIPEGDYYLPLFDYNGSSYALDPGYRARLSSDDVGFFWKSLS